MLWRIGSVIEAIHFKEWDGKEHGFVLEGKGVGGLSLVSVTTYLQAHCLELWLLFHDKRRMAKTREVVEDRTDRAVTESKPEVARY